jgi:hypothetical protein
MAEGALSALGYPRTTDIPMTTAPLLDRTDIVLVVIVIVSIVLVCVL